MSDFESGWNASCATNFLRSAGSRTDLRLKLFVSSCGHVWQAGKHLIRQEPPPDKGKSIRTLRGDLLSKKATVVRVSNS